MTTTNGRIDYVIFSDTNCGIDDVISRKYDIELISDPLRVKGTDYYPYLGKKPFDFDSFFVALRETDRVYTWKVTTEGYKEYFRPFLKKGKNILYIHFSHFGTNTFDVDLPNAIRELREEFPGREIVAFDSRSVAQGSIPLIVGAAVKRLSGSNMRQVEEFLAGNVGKRIAYFIPDNLTYLAKYGKVGGVSAFVGNALRLKPVMEVDVSGNMSVVMKFVGGDLTLSKRLLIRMEKEGYPKDGRIEIGYTDSRERGERFMESFSSMAKRMGKGPFTYEISRINPLHSGIIGPLAIGVAYTLEDV